MKATLDNKFNKTFFLIVICLFGLFLMYSLWEYFTAFLGSVLFYVLFKSRMHHLVYIKKWKKSLAAILLMFYSFVIILLPIFIFSTMIYNKVVPLASNPDILMPYINDMEAMIHQKFGVELLSINNLDYIKTISTTLLSSLLNQSLTIFSSIAMMYFFLYFMLVGGNRMEAGLMLLLPFKKEKIKMFSKELKSQTFSNAVGIPLIAVMQGIFAYFIYLICGVPEPGFWGILTGFASIIPIVGTAIIWVPLVSYLFFIGNIWQAIVVIIWCSLVLGSMDNVIRFLLAKRMSDVHPIITVLGIIVGIKYFGFTGIIFGPLLISYFFILLKIYYSDYRGIAIKHKAKENTYKFKIPFVKKNNNIPKEK